MVNKLTEKDEQGNWCVKGISWKQLEVGKPITREVQEKLYGCLEKLMEYEDKGVSPDQVEMMLDGSYPPMKKCPKCGRYFERLLAVSRSRDRNMICTECGILEALEEFNRKVG